MKITPTQRNTGRPPFGCCTSRRNSQELTSHDSNTRKTSLSDVPPPDQDVYILGDVRSIRVLPNYIFHFQCFFASVVRPLGLLCQLIMFPELVRCSILDFLRCRLPFRLPLCFLTVKPFVFCLQPLLVSLGQVLVSIQILNRLPSIIFLQWVVFPDHQVMFSFSAG